MFAYYSFLVTLFVMAASVAKRFLSLRDPRHTSELDERLGRRVHRQIRKGTGVVINAVSVGEVAEAESLIRALRNEVPGLEILLTVGNRDGRARAEQLAARLGGRIEVSLLPWDRRRVLRRWLRQLSPSAVIILESDIWPNLILASSDNGIPVCIVNGRIYDADVARYRIALYFFRALFRSVRWIGVRNEKEKERFLSIGAREEQITICDDLKFSLTPAAEIDRRLQYFLTADAGPLLIAGSTHDPEEEMFSRMLSILKPEYPEARMVIAPRDVTRCTELSGRLNKHGRTVAWSSAGEFAVSGWDILLLDRIGMLPAIYASGTIAIMGGTFVPSGGHNPVEPALAELPVLAGPHRDHFEEMFECFSRMDAVRYVNTPEELLTEVRTLLGDATLRNELGRRASLVVREHSGAAGEYAARLRGFLTTHLPASAPGVETVG